VTEPVHDGVSVVLFKAIVVLELVHEPTKTVGREGGARGVLVAGVEEFEIVVVLG
jgi:hypothetical protein